MTLPADRLCLFASPRADDAKGQSSQRLRGAGLALSPWPPPDSRRAPPSEFDALVVIGGRDAWPKQSLAPLVAVLRQAWLRGRTIGLFGGAVEFLAAADIGADAAPIEAAGLFIDEETPNSGMVQEMIDAMQSGPHLQR